MELERVYIPPGEIEPSKWGLEKWLKIRMMGIGHYPYGDVKGKDVRG